MKAWIFFFYSILCSLEHTWNLVFGSGYYPLRGLLTNWYTCREERGDSDKGNGDQVIRGVVKETGIFNLVKR